MRAAICAVVVLLLAAGCTAAIGRPAMFTLGPETEPAEADAALRQAAPPGSRAGPLLAALRGRFGDQPMTLTQDIRVDDQVLVGHAFRQVVPRGAGNADHWVIRVLETADGEVWRAWLRRYFRDRDFAARGRAFAFADFERPGDAEAALRALVGPEWNAAEVDRTMRAAGAVAADTEGAAALYDYREPTEAPWPLPSRWRTAWRFDAAGQATSVDVGSLPR